MYPPIHRPLFTALPLAFLALVPTGTAGAAQTRIDTQLGVCCVKTVINPAADISESLTKTSLQGGTGIASAFASVSGGVLKSKVESVSGGLRAPSNSASAYATITDVITVSNAALTGQAGFAHIVLDYNLTFGVAGTSAFADVGLRMKWAAVRAEVLWQGGISCQQPTQCSETDQRSATWAPDSRTQSIPLAFGQPISIDIPIVFGRADDFELFLGADASSGQRFGEEVSRAFVDGAHSVYWGGVTAVTDSQGNLVQALVGSQSGTDYQRSYVPSAVPEPGAAALWWGGLAAMASVVRRRRRNGPGWRAQSRGGFMGRWVQQAALAAAVLAVRPDRSARRMAGHPALRV